MNGILEGSVLAEEVAGVVGYRSLIERVRDQADDSEATFQEAAQVLREVRALLQELKPDWQWTAASVLTPELVDRLNFAYTHEIAAGEYARLDIIESMGGVTPDGRQVYARGYLVAVELLELSVPVLERLLYDPRAADLLKRITDKTRYSREPDGAALYSLTCDGIDDQWDRPCRKPSRHVASEEQRDVAARSDGWLVSDEKDLCPACWIRVDPEVASDVFFGAAEKHFTQDGGHYVRGNLYEIEGNSFIREFLIHVSSSDLRALLPEAEIRAAQYSGELRDYIDAALRFAWVMFDDDPATAPVKFGVGAGQLPDVLPGSAWLLSFVEGMRRFMYLEAGLQSVKKILSKQFTPSEVRTLRLNLQSVERIVAAVRSQSTDSFALSPEGVQFLSRVFDWLTEYGGES